MPAVSSPAPAAGISGGPQLSFRKTGNVRESIYRSRPINKFNAHGKINTAACRHTVQVILLIYPQLLCVRRRPRVYVIDNTIELNERRGRLIVLYITGRHVALIIKNNRERSLNRGPVRSRCSHVGGSPGLAVVKHGCFQANAPRTDVILKGYSCLFFPNFVLKVSS